MEGSADIYVWIRRMVGSASKLVHLAKAIDGRNRGDHWLFSTCAGPEVALPTHVQKEMPRAKT